MKKVFFGQIVFTVVTKRLFKYYEEQIPIDFPRLLFSLSETSAKNEIALSDFWREAMPEKPIVRILNKEIRVFNVLELTTPSVIYILENMRVEDGIAFLKQEFEKI